MGALYRIKVAAGPDGDPEESHTARNVAMGAAALAPFAGMVGQQPIIHDPHLNRGIHRFNTVEQLQRRARPGDVILTSKPTGTIWKHMISPVTGSDFYHVQEVVGRRRGDATTTTAGHLATEDIAGNRRALGKLPSIAGYSDAYGYPDVLLLRPKKRMTPTELRAFQDEVVRRSAQTYNDGRAVETWIKDVFMPKIKGRERAAAPPVCEGDVCSTSPAAGYRAAGRAVVPGKKPSEVFPSDYLRSKNFKAVGARLSGESRWSPLTRRAVPLVTRAGIGAAMAGGTYLATENPDIVGAAAGAGLGLTLANKYLRDPRYPKYPLQHTWGLLANLGVEKGRDRLQTMATLAKKYVPAVAGGYLGYKAIGKIRDVLGGRRPAGGYASGDDAAVPTQAG